MKLLYTFAIHLFTLALKLASPFYKKAKQLNRGRKSTWNVLKKIHPDDKVVWIHAASLGEFEQGRPIIEAIRNEKSEYKILLSFFSPSGYEIRKNYNLADWVVYLPADTAANAKRFIKDAHPSMSFFVKYEFWYHYYATLAVNRIPVYSVSSIFRNNQVFFKWYGKWFRKTLKAVDKFYVQDEKSGALLTGIGITNFTVAGDTRFDRVAAIAALASEVPVAKQFATTNKVLIAGSTWAPDEAILAEYINSAVDDVKMIIAPHETDEAHVAQIMKRFTAPALRYSQRESINNPEAYRVLVIDTIGLLSAIYRYGTVACIGGGFGKGIHNTLEAATFGMPVVFGPNHKKFREAIDLLACGGGFTFNNYDDFRKIMDMLWNSASLNALTEAGEAAGNYVKNMCGATALIMNDAFYKYNNEQS
ncbi:MAG: 3-deoxy-D-manno-octulosonic acid transferase [Cytophagaceae bacterium]|jgi:3-deoxy-D-manno-octulosonic-acid transferase|nr:3-deoxy-D-manno-octulosonic acid transferase [Cytophagaceae bacterium]